jgi:hypothetical protein
MEARFLRAALLLLVAAAPVAGLVRHVAQWGKRAPIRTACI